MTTLIVKVDDDSTDSLKKILQEIPYVREVSVENEGSVLKEANVQYIRIKGILDDAKGKNLFQDIKDPTEWQRDLRKEWDRDL